jgi:ABC-type uncharacterized transport system substrate-binding protein
MILRLSCILVFSFMAGCSLLPSREIPPSPPPELPPAVDPEPEPVEPQPEPEPVVEPAPEPEPEPEPIPEYVEPLVAVVLSNRTPAYVEVANALEGHLDQYEIYDLDDRSLPARDAFAAISESGAIAIVAIGLPAARAARRFATVPVVVGQVFNINDAELLSDEIKAVSVLPPIGLQMDAWHKIDPSVRNVGAILGSGHEELIEEADAALRERGVKLHYAIAESDRETLYLFNRLVRDIDGFILFPDNRILSRTVLTEMMSYASRHRVQVAVFNDPLLEIGAIFSAGSVESDIAARISQVLNQLIDGEGDAVPPITALSEIEIRTNDAVLQRLGLEPAGEESGDATVADTQ